MDTLLGARDRIATLLVAAAAVVYVAWLTGFAGGLSAGGAALVILALGFLASAAAVVPGFAALLHGSRPYLGWASLLGVIALVAGVFTVANATGDTLAILVAATVVLWAGATLRHAGLGQRASKERLERP